MAATVKVEQTELGVYEDVVGEHSFTVNDGSKTTAQEGEDYTISGDLSEENHVYKYRVTITNDFTSKSIFAKIALTGHDKTITGLTITAKLGEQVYVTGTEVEIPATENIVLEVVYSINMNEVKTFESFNIGALVSLAVESGSYVHA